MGVDPTTIEALDPSRQTLRGMQTSTEHRQRFEALLVRTQVVSDANVQLSLLVTSAISHIVMPRRSLVFT
jgi:hypothetical protein